MSTEPKKDDVLDVNPLIQNALSVWRRASKQDLADGVSWYVTANELAHDIALGTNITPQQVMGVISTMSPRMPWGRNKVVARKLVKRFLDNDNYKGIGLGANCFIAYVILSGNSTPEDMLINKREAFYQNINGRLDRATIDSWMCKVLFGADTTFVSPGRYYEACENAIIEAAAIAGLNPRDFQAACWVCIRRELLSEKELANYESEEE